MNTGYYTLHQHRSERAKNVRDKYAKSGITLNLRGSEVQVYDSIVKGIVNKHPDVIYLTDRMYSNNIQIEANNG
jgi:hypothetical protein